MQTKYVFAFCNSFLKIDLNCSDWMLPNLTLVLIYSLTKCCVLEDVLTTPVLKILQYLQENIRDGV